MFSTLILSLKEIRTSLGFSLSPLVSRYERKRVPFEVEDRNTETRGGCPLRPGGYDSRQT